MIETPFANIIFDVPSKTDDFDGKGHERSAKALSEGIHQVFSNGGGAIGLEGSWGAGKSSVIEMATQQLDKLAPSESADQFKYHVFTFDLWTHQTDEFRRAFLERFLDFMQTAKFEHKVDLEEQRDRIRNRKKEVTNESKRRYTTAGAIIVLLLPFLPLAYAWLNPAAFVSANKLKPFPGLDFVLPLPGILSVIAIASVLIGLVYFRREFLRAASDTALKTFGERLARATSNILTLTKQVDQETTVQWIRDEDPTTVEFQKTFHEIFGAAQTSANRLVFVLDNIDRLSKDSVKDAWSEMRSLLSGHKSDTAKQPVVVVVPYDRDIITRSLGLEHQDADLFAKTFQRILRVSPPLGSHWVGYLEVVLHKAFGDQHKDEAIYRLHRLLQFNLQSKNKLATPRKIVGFVNDLGAYWTQWGGTIPVESMAVFVLLRDELYAYFSDIGKDGLDLAAYQRIARQEDLLRHLGALHFNVAIADAEELLLAGPLANALVAPTPEPLRNLRQMQGFDRLFTRFLAGALESRTEDPAAIARAALNIDALNLTGDLKDEVALHLGDYLPKIGDFDLDDPGHIREGLFTILRMQPRSAVRSLVAEAKSLVERIQAKDKETVEFEKGRGWADYVTEFAALLTSMLDPEAGQSWWKGSFPRSSSADFALGVAYLVEEREDFAYLTLAGTPAAADLAASLQPHIQENPRVVKDVIREMGSAFTSDMKASLANAISAYLKSAVLDPKVADHLLVACGLVRATATEKQLNAALKQMTSDGTVLFYTSRSTDAEATAAGLFLLAQHYGVGSAAPGADPHPVLGALAQPLTWYTKAIGPDGVPDEVVIHMAEAVAATNRFGVWLGYAASQPLGSLFGRVVGGMLEIGSLGGTGSVAVKALIENYADLEARFSYEGMELLVRTLGGALRSDVEIDDAVLMTLPRGLVDSVGKWSPGTPLGNLIPRIDAWLKAVPAARWEEALGAGDPEVGMLIIRIENDRLKLTAKEYLEGYKANALNVLCQDQEPQLAASDWAKLYEAVPVKSRGVLARKVMEDLPRKGAKPDGVSEFVECYPDLAASLPLEDFPENAVQILLRELALQGDDNATNYVREKMGQFKKAMKALQKRRATDAPAEEAIAAFEDALVSLDELTDPVSQEWAAELRGGLELPKPEPVPEPEPEEKPGE
jgi:hypothetical protein